MLDAYGRELHDGGAALAQVSTVDRSDLHPRLTGAEVVIACDVDNPLTGPAGAATVYGPQKGASVVDVAVGSGLCSVGRRHSRSPDLRGLAALTPVDVNPRALTKVYRIQ